MDAEAEALIFDQGPRNLPQGGLEALRQLVEEEAFRPCDRVEVLPGGALKLQAVIARIPEASQTHQLLQVAQGPSANQDDLDAWTRRQLLEEPPGPLR